MLTWYLLILVPVLAYLALAVYRLGRFYLRRALVRRELRALDEAVRRQELEAAALLGLATMGAGTGRRP